MNEKELGRLEIDELLDHAETGEQARVEAGLELLRRRQAKQLRKHSKTKQSPRAEAHKPVGLATGPDT